MFTVKERGDSVVDRGRDREMERRRLCEKAEVDRERESVFAGEREANRERRREVCKLKAGFEVEMCYQERSRP